MAPRGGRGGGGSGGGSIDNQCGRYNAFESDYAKAQIGLMGGFLFLFLVLAYCTASRSGKRKKAGQEKSILRWFQYGIALFLIIALFIMLIVRYALIECGVLYVYGYDDTAIGTATIVVNNVAELFMLGIVLFVVTKRMFQLAGSSSLKRTMLILSGIFFGIVCVVFVVYIVLYGLIRWDVGDIATRTTINSYNRLVQAYVVLYLLLAIFAVIGLIMAVIRLARKPERKQGVTGWVPVLIICLLGYSFYNAVLVFLQYYDDDALTPIGIIVSYALSLLWFFGSFFSIFMIARGKGWDFLRLPQDIQPEYNFAGPPPTMAYNQTPYDTMQSPDAAKRMSYASHGNAPTPAPPYMGGTGMAYSGNGVYEPQGQTYGAGGWGTSGYAPVGQMPTSYNAPMGAASRDAEHNELTGRR
ncbi:hypothetical protein TWF730_001896 [Orbilia blumenaviensis]|uniref:Uncharacterized protein n=1 Tax=Orbilia blumenaviensis TaxID=1796055 RepID=A0AAV9UCT5_9PEZI